MAVFPHNHVKYRSQIASVDRNVVSYVESLSGKFEIIKGEQNYICVELQTVPLNEFQDKMFNVFLQEIRDYSPFNFFVKDTPFFKPVKVLQGGTLRADSLTVVGTDPLIGQVSFEVDIPQVQGDAMFDLAIGDYFNFDHDEGYHHHHNIKKFYMVTDVDPIFVGGEEGAPDVNYDRWKITVHEPIRYEPTVNDDNTRTIYYGNPIGCFYAEDGNFVKSKFALDANGNQLVQYKFKIKEKI